MTHTREKRVIGFFVAKGLLISSAYEPAGSAKLKASDILYVAAHVEPRILEVLPAALIHFPKSFLDKERLPKAVHDVVAAIKAGNETGRDLAGIKYKDMARWANLKLEDKRAVPLSERKVLRAFRLKPKTLEILEAKAKARGITVTSLIERLAAEAL